MAAGRQYQRYGMEDHIPHLFRRFRETFGPRNRGEVLPKRLKPLESATGETIKYQYTNWKEVEKTPLFPVSPPKKGVRR